MTSKSLKRARQKAQKQATELAASGTLAKSAHHGKRRDWTKLIGEAMVACKWQQALQCLRSMREAGQVPKLGAVQRWVRMADLTGREELAALLLDAIMRTAAGTSGAVKGQGAKEASAQLPSTDKAGASSSPGIMAMLQEQRDSLAGSIRRHDAWCPSEPGPATGAEASSNGAEAAAAEAAARCEGHLHIVGTDVAPKMTTTNPIFMTDPGVVQFDEDGPDRRPVSRVEVPFVDGAFVLTGVLSRREAAQIVAVSERMGYAFDADYTFGAASGQAGVADFPGDSVAADAERSAPPGSSSGSGAPGESARLDEGVRDQSAARASIGGERAAGCVWLADESLQGPLWERVRALLPQQRGGGALAGLNARWRLYRYDQGTVYRPHVDGAWPGSGLRDGQVVFDYYGDRWSHLTFLIYLNDGFEGGSTTFYTPGEEEGILEARGVSPRAGNILVFPHGDTTGSLVHEGSAVTRGAKYVIRTDVLYMLPPKDKIRGNAKGGGASAKAGGANVKGGNA